MFKNISDIFKLLKNYGPLQEQMEEVKQRIARLHITGEAGAGMVKVTVSGEGRVTDCRIDKALIDGDDLKLMEDLIISAVNDALEKSRAAVSYEMQRISGLENLPNFEEMFKNNP